MPLNHASFAFSFRFFSLLSSNLISFALLVLLLFSVSPYGFYLPPVNLFLLFLLVLSVSFFQHKWAEDLQKRKVADEAFKHTQQLLKDNTQADMMEQAFQAIALAHQNQPNNQEYTNLHDLVSKARDSVNKGQDAVKKASQISDNIKKEFQLTLAIKTFAEARALLPECSLLIRLHDDANRQLTDYEVSRQMISLRRGKMMIVLDL